MRTKTGASIVAVERAGINLINPDPDEELRDGDRVFLLGTHEQIDCAKKLLQAPN